MKRLITLFSALTLSAAAYAQIPNPGFESWTNMGAYSTPDGWDNADSLGTLASTYTCEQGSLGFSGNHYLKLTSKNTIAGVIAGIAMSGKIDFTTFLPKSGFAYTGRPAFLTGEWQHVPASVTDSGIIAVVLTKWTGTGRDTVAYIYNKLPDTVTTWTAFSIPLIYLRSENPDTAEIYFSSSTATTAAAGSYMYVDTLAFAGTVTGITSINYAHTSVSVSPNPSQGTFALNISSSSNESAEITITNMMGAKVKEITTTTNKATTLQLHEPTGIYFINVITSHAQLSEKIVVLR